jgi:AbrB family looped-hinge helix DNA binding protein
MITREPLEARARITSKGQITLPKSVRDRLRLKPGEEVQFVESGGEIRVRRPPRQSKLDKWVGYLAREHPIDMTDEEYIAASRGR